MPALHLKILPLLIAAFLSALAAPLVAGEFLIICSGQSNMAGVGPITELPDNFKSAAGSYGTPHLNNVPILSAPRRALIAQCLFGFFL